MATLTQLSADQINSMTAKELRPIAQELQLVGAWKATKQQLQEMLTNYFEGPELASPVEALESAYNLPNFVLVTNPTDELPQYYGPQLGKFSETTTNGNQVNQTAVLALPPAAKKQTKKQTKKEPKVIEQLAHLTESDLEYLEGFTQVSSSSCSDPGKTIIKRVVLAQVIQDKLDVYVAPKVFNQIVVIASRKLPRMPMTIQSASRFKYLLASPQKAQKYSPAILVLDWLLDNPQVIQEAAQAYQVAASEGMDHIQAYLQA